MLGEIMEILRGADQMLVLPLGFNKAFSYRGDYAQLGVKRAENVSVAEMLAVLTVIKDTVQRGYKGGEYTMSEYVDVYLVEDHSSCGEQLGPLFLNTMIAAAAAARKSEADRNALVLTSNSNGAEAALAQVQGKDARNVVALIDERMGKGWTRDLAHALFPGNPYFANDAKKVPRG